ncbi:2,3-bisphosphoglycerate-independent phosphoglycerate mutase [Thiomicrospira sp. ALE5]|uniref:2,3-bisphosphoglycerate-independent phosphoglycerate mutase n=1 Tax=Thiomicrospira sp. ALE5 TaxID=748650 RepID=UPI0008E319D4|nr:2,3-bisphosphoglycerate-independent phosphoglycerate mutase [Thiomicrospira sp. ALE5]SFR63334.1 phosphoglycerate mutase [Thiomicrospira sp. ALE5]
MTEQTIKTAKPVGLIILDGWGHNPNNEHNAIAQAQTPTWDSILQNNPNTLINTSGLNVGLPDGQMGNSEVGHLNLGAGRVVYQELTRIQKAIEDGIFFDNSALVHAIDSATSRGRAVHILGLVSDGGVHSHINHLKAAASLAIKRGAKTNLHLFTDGRDTAPESALGYVRDIEQHLKSLDSGRIASITGRYFAMDRDNRWERTQKAFDVIASGQGDFTADSAKDAIKAAYARGETDEFILPTAIVKKNGKPIKIKDGDAIIFMNYRADRARQLTRPFIERDFADFHRDVSPILSDFVTLTEYNKNFNVSVAFRPTKLINTFGEWVSKQGLTQLRIAETEKYAHVTFFLNGGVEAPNKNEDRILIPSPKVATYDLQPEMSINELTDKLCDAISSQKYDTFICNIANPDMVGHSGNLAACIKAVEAVDAALARITAAMTNVEGELLITADHGNIEQLWDETTNSPLTAHTTNPVPFVYIGKQGFSLRENGSLPDVIPTLLKLMNLSQPEEMTGQSICID